MFKKTIAIITLIVLIGCNNNGDQNFISDFRDEINKGVNIWVSANYEIIRDKESINRFDPLDSSLEHPVMLRIFMEAMKKGNQRADSIEVVLNEPTPYLQNNGRSYGGVTHGYLDQDEIIE